MLQVYHSNRLELLFEILCAQRSEQALDDPFRADQILVANPGIGRWLSLQFAEREGIAANLDYPLPASYIWKLYREHLPCVPERSAFNKPRLQWTLMQLLADLPDEPIYAALHQYLQVDSREQRKLKQVQLAAKIADVFDQYLVYRPDWLLAWEQGESGDTATAKWQSALWRQLCAQLREPHRGSLHRDFLDAARKGKLDSGKLPERLFIFNVVSIPPSYLDVLTALAQLVPVDLYLLNPSVEYWDEISSRKQQLKLRKQHGGDAPVDDGNALLAATGTLGRNALRLLHERGKFVHEENFSIPPEQSGRLAQLQREILTLSQASEELGPQLGLALEEPSGAAGDTSIEVHSAHSVLREVQVLHDQLLARFERIKDLKPADIVVMVPNVDAYTAAVAAVFGSAPSERYIPWEIADRSLTQTDPVVALVRALLDLPQSQFKASEVLGWLSQPVLARKFGFAEPKNQHQLSRWVERSAARRLLGSSPLAKGVDSPINSWAFALRRLLAGYALATDELAVGGVYPASGIDAPEAVLLGRLIECLDRFAHWSVALHQPRSMQAWLEIFNRLVEDLLEPDDDEAFGIQQLRDCLADLSQNASLSGYSDELEASAMLALLDNALAGTGGKTQRFLTGKVTISSMVPLRSVPFRVVCLLGLNDGEFPRQNRPVSFDLIQHSTRIGDRSVREDDHYLFLEALLSARDELLLSWIGRSAVDNSEQTPSVLLAELLEYFKGQALEVLQHPLQAFSPRYFDGEDDKLRSYASQWLPHVSEARQGQSAPEYPPGRVLLPQLIRFWCDPVGCYCRDTLRMNLYAGSTLAVDTEPFELDALESYQLREQLLSIALGDSPQSKQQALQAAIGRGEMPHGKFAEFSFEQSFAEAQKLATRVLAERDESLSPIAFEVDIGPWQVAGQLADLHLSEGLQKLVMARPGRFNGKDRIRFLLTHLVACAAGLLQADSVFLPRDKSQSLPLLSREAAIEELQLWLDNYGRGQSEALHFFPNCSGVWAARREDDTPAVLEGPWVGGDYNRGEAESEAVRLLWPNVDNPIALKHFESLAEQLLKPAVQVQQEKGA
ncbi:MAG: exodeoxyribonuclease V subunit gamma [Granulosicoccaceae bacterium]